MKTKTATIDTYRQYGSRYHYYYADIYYRGKRIARKGGFIERDVLQDAVSWILDNGFTHYRLRVN